MGVQRSVRIDAEVVSVGQFDRTERWKSDLAIERLTGGRVRVGNPTQSGFEAIIFDFDDLVEAVQALND